MDEAVEELELTHAILLKNSTGDQERMFINKIKRMREQLTQRDHVVSKLQSSLLQNETLMLHTTKKELDHDELEQLRIDFEMHQGIVKEKDQLIARLKEVKVNLQEKNAEAANSFLAIEQQVVDALEEHDSPNPKPRPNYGTDSPASTDLSLFSLLLSNRKTYLNPNPNPDSKP